MCSKLAVSKLPMEESYKHMKSNEWGEDEKMVTMPVLIDTRKNYKILISESSLTDYPATFFKSTGNGLYAVHPKQPIVFGEDGDRSQKLLKEADYIAKTNGNRSFLGVILSLVEKMGNSSKIR